MNNESRMVNVNKSQSYLFPLHDEIKATVHETAKAVVLNYNCNNVQFKMLTETCKLPLSDICLTI